MHSSIYPPPCLEVRGHEGSVHSLEFRNFGILDFGILEFWNFGILDFGILVLECLFNVYV